MILQFTIAALLIVMTIMVHAFMLDIVVKKVGLIETMFIRFFVRMRRALTLVCVVLAVYTAHIIQIWIWGLFFMLVGEFDTLEAALYFSTSAFTTLGMGDVVLSDEWRLMGSIEAANGFLLFGWSTAFIFEVMSQLYRKEAEVISDQSSGDRV
mgnify:FL=1